MGKKRWKIEIMLLAAAVFCVLGSAAGVFAEGNPAPQASKGVVQVLTVKENGLSSGTAFGVGEAGKDTDVFVTNRHVVVDDDGNVADVYLVMDNGLLQKKEGWEVDWDQVVRCEVLYTTEGYPDLAIIRAAEPLTGIKALPLLRSESVPVGTRVWALGYPGMTNEQASTGGRISDITVTDGVISRFMLNSNYGNTNVILHQAHIEHGNSGGPLLTADGAVIGINTYSLGEIFEKYGESDVHLVPEYFVAVYIDYAMEALDELGIHYDIYEESKEEESRGEGTDSYAQLAVVAAAAAVGAAAVILFIYIIRKAPQREKPVPEKTQFAVRAEDGVLKGTVYPLSEKELYFGRDSSCCGVAFPPNEKAVSRRHCLVRVQGGTVWLTDLGSSYGTVVNGRKLLSNQAVQLVEGCRFCVGLDTSNYFIVIRNG